MTHPPSNLWAAQTASEAPAAPAPAPSPATPASAHDSGRPAYANAAGALPGGGPGKAGQDPAVVPPPAPAHSGACLAPEAPAPPGTAPHTLYGASGQDSAFRGGSNSDLAAASGIVAAVLRLSGSGDEAFRDVLAPFLREPKILNILIEYTLGLVNQRGHSRGQEVRLALCHDLLRQLHRTGLTHVQLHKELTSFQANGWPRERYEPNKYNPDNPDQRRRFLMFTALAVNPHVPSINHLREILRNRDARQKSTMK